jgi:RNA polymerase sigma-70 factor (ECF subfamily)
MMRFLESRNRILYVSVKTNGSRVRIIYTEEQTALQNREKIKEIYDRQVDRVYRTAMVFMKNTQDAEDIVQSVFLTLIEKGIQFDTPEHEKAWFIVTTRNRCKDILKSYWRKSVDLVEEGMDETADSVSTDPPGSDFRAEALDIIMNLPEDQREIILLHYYEGYTVKETADMLKLSESKVRSQIASAKRALSKLTRR